MSIGLIQENQLANSSKQTYPRMIYSADQVRELDRITINELGVPGYELMHRASKFTFQTLRRVWPGANKIIVLCGSGNNGGDGYLVAAMAKERGLSPSVFTTKSPDSLSGDAKTAYEKCLSAGVTIQLISNTTDLTTQLTHADLIVDAMLGTGLNSDVKGMIFEIVKLCNQSVTPILSVDIPSGLCANTGQALGISIKADATSTFIAMKVGQLTGQGRLYCGDLYFNDLKVPEEAYNLVPHQVERLELNSLLEAIPDRQITAHKGDHGKVVLVGGDKGYGGAIILAATAAARLGAGLTKVATQAENYTAMLSHCPEVMPSVVNSIHELRPLLDQAEVIVIGPGLGQSAWSHQMLKQVLEYNKPTVLDADALNILARNPTWLPADTDNLFYTPHPGEAARLMNCFNNTAITTKDIEKDRLSALKRLHDQLGGHILLKGSGSLIQTPNGTYICTNGNPGMATGGMGDVLSGIIGSLLAQKLPSELAITASVVLHATSADTLAKRQGEKGLLASDLIPVARQLINGI